MSLSWIVDLDVGILDRENLGIDGILKRERHRMSTYIHTVRSY